MGPKSQVSSPTHASKSQNGGKVPTFEPQETIKNMVNKLDLDYVMQKYLWDL